MGRVLADGVGAVWVRAEKGGPTKQVVFRAGEEVPDWAAKQLGDHCFEDGADTDEQPSTADAYKGWTVAQLSDEIEKRNDARDDDEQIVVEGKGTKADLTAALVADDAALDS